MPTMTFAETKNTEIVEILRNYTKMVMKDADPNMKKPLTACSDYVFPKEPVPIPKEPIEYVENAEGVTNVLEGKQALGTLVYDTWTHLNDDVNDLYTYRIQTMFGEKCITYKNEHPTLEQMEQMRHYFAEDYINELKDGEKEESVLHLIAMEVADYVLGDDFVIFFGERLELLHDDTRADFYQDAQRLLDELKQIMNK